MSQFMQKVVSEVLRRNETRAGGESPLKPTDTTNSTDDSSSSMPDIYRPNYQRQKQKERLSPTTNAPANSLPNTPKFSQEFMDNQISALQRMTAAQTLSNLGSTTTASGLREGARLIGKTRNQQQIWYFPSADHRLLSPTGQIVGFITGVSVNPGTLFLVDERMKAFPEIMVEPFGELKANGWMDTVKLTSKDGKALEALLKDLYNQLNRVSIRSFQAYLSEHPSSFLLGTLNGSTSGSIAGLVGIASVTALGLLDRHFHRHPADSFGFHLRENCLIISGEYRVIQHAIQQLEDDAGQLLS